MLQGLNVLKLGAQELQELIQEQLVENPAIELPDPGEDPQAADAERSLWDAYSRGGPATSSNGQQSREMPNPVELAASPESLADHLALQLDLEDLTPSQRRIGAAIIGSLDSEGYLHENASELAEITGSSETEVETVLATIQGFDPPGVAARNLSECLLIQLDEDQAVSLPGRIVSDCLSLLARGAHCEIAAALSADSREVMTATRLIRSLNPSPGAAFDQGPPAATVIPDVFIRISVEGPVVLANRRVMPSLAVSTACRRMLEDPATGAGEKDYIRKRIARASELVDEIEQRRQTLTAVARAIAEMQPDFFESGPAGLRQAGLQEVATLLDVHISTVSRAIKGKYLSTAFGIFEFRYFFPSGCSTDGGGNLAAPAIKDRLGHLIETENNERPLSDQKLARVLGEDGIRISRRTVTKYREDMGLPSSYGRRKRA